MKKAYFLYTGFGKTKLMLDKIMDRTLFPTKPKVLLISTKNIVESSWIGEIDKWYPNQITYSFITGKVPANKRLDVINKHTDIFAMNTDMIQWYINNTTPINKKGKHDCSCMKDRFDFIIIDESSLFKSYSSERFKLIKNWCSSIEHVAILSATPTPKSIEDIWSQIYLLDSGQRLGKTITQFRNDYGIAIPLSNGYNRYDYPQKSVDYILTLIKDIVVSIPEPSTPLFPPPRTIKVKIKPDDELNNILATFKEDNIVMFDDVKLKSYSINQLIIKINQLASGSVYVDGTVKHISNAKFNYLRQLLNTINTPVLITYMYKFDKEKLLTLDGARLLDNPQAFKDWNDNKIKIGILSPFSVAHGINLQQSDCQDIIWFSPIWDTEKWLQTNARVCRRGQTHQVTIRVLLLKGSYDDYCFDLVQDKYKLEYNNLVKLS